MWVVMLQEPSLGVKGRGQKGETTALLSSAGSTLVKGKAGSQPQAPLGRKPRGREGPRRHSQTRRPRPCGVRARTGRGGLPAGRAPRGEAGRRRPRGPKGSRVTLFIPLPMAAARSSSAGAAAAGALRACRRGAGRRRRRRGGRPRPPRKQRQGPGPPGTPGPRGPSAPAPAPTLPPAAPAFPAAGQRHPSPGGRDAAARPLPQPAGRPPATPRGWQTRGLGAGPGGRAGTAAPRRTRARAPAPAAAARWARRQGGAGGHAGAAPTQRGVSRAAPSPPSGSPKLPEAFPRGGRGPVTSSRRPALTAWVNQVLTPEPGLAAPLPGFSECDRFRQGGGIPAALPHPRRPRRLAGGERWAR